MKRVLAETITSLYKVILNNVYFSTERKKWSHFDLES